eukprot:COSAG01_NODE_9777_length_2347_cov_1.999555_1_plen_404_part_00
MAESRYDGASARKDFIPFYGWEDTPRVGLEESVKDLPIPRIDKYAGASVDFADDYLRRHGGVDPFGLDREEIAAFNLYSKANLTHPDQGFFAVMNRTLNEKDRRKLVPFFPYLRIVFDGAKKSKNACPLTLLRGFPNRRDNWQEEYKIGEVIYWWGFSSTTRKSRVLDSDDFFGASGDRTLFMLDCIAGVDVTPYSDYAHEEEVLLMPGAKFEVTQTMPPSLMSGVAAIMMKQLPTRHEVVCMEGVPPEPEPEPEPLANPEPEPEPLAPLEPEPEPLNHLSLNGGMDFESALQTAIQQSKQPPPKPAKSIMQAAAVAQSEQTAALEAQAAQQQQQQHSAGLDPSADAAGAPGARRKPEPTWVRKAQRFCGQITVTEAVQNLLTDSSAGAQSEGCSLLGQLCRG